MEESRNYGRCMRRPALFATCLLATQLVMANPTGGGDFYLS